METWILIAMFLVGFGMASYGFVRKSFPAAFVGGMVLLLAGAILYTDGYNTYTTCQTPNSCTEITTFTYDANSNLIRTDMNVFKMNANASDFSDKFGLIALFGGMFLIILAGFNTFIQK